jgi:glycosyltransferase involved in cell wall biosynthesis
MTTPKVSIITANYNGEQFISETITSVLNQTYRDWELILIDDASSDSSVQIMESFVKDNERISLYRFTKNIGAAIARNKGIELAKGKYIAFLDGDDLWKPEKLSKQLRFMESFGHDFTFTSYDRIDESSKPLNKSLLAQPLLSYRDMLKENKIGCLTAIYNSESLGKIYMPEIRKRQDYGLWLRILKRVDYAYGMPESLAFYRVRENSISRSKFEMLRWNFRLFRDVEGFSFVRSCYQVSLNIFTKIMKG